MENRINKIDWLNHMIAFLSALLGIVIAFQLEDFQEDQKAQEDLQITLIAIKKEVENNQSIYRTNIETLSEFLDYISVLEDKNDKEYRINKNKFDKIKSKSPDRFADWKLKRQENDSTLIFEPFDIDVPAPETGISTSSWKAGIYSGILNRLDHSNLSKLTHIYEWIEKDIGLNEVEFLENVVMEKFHDIDIIVNYYTRLTKIQQMKLGIVSDYYDQIEWE